MFMGKPCENGMLFSGNQNKRDDRGSAIVIVIIAVALIGMLATAILWASYLNYRIKINDLKAKNSFYSAETVVEQIVAGIKRDVVSVALGSAYQEVISNWDGLGTDEIRERYFAMAYTESVEKLLGVSVAGTSKRYDKDKLHDYVDEAFWDENNPSGHVRESVWDSAVPVFLPADDLDGNGSMEIKNIRVEFYDSNGYLSIINTDIAIDVPKLRFTQAGTIDRLYPYALVGDTGIEFAGALIANIEGSVYGGVDDEGEGGIIIGENSTVTVQDAGYVISGGDIVVGNASNFTGLIHQGASLSIKEGRQGGEEFCTNVYARGLALNGSHLDVSGRMYIGNDLVLSGKGSSVSLAGQYYGYGNTDTVTKTTQENLAVNPADTSSSIVVNGKDSSVDLTGLTTLQLGGRAYVALPQEGEADNGLPHVLMGESISVKSNQIAYLVPPECIGTLDGRTVIGQNPMSFDTWTRMMGSLPGYEAQGVDFRIVDAGKSTDKLGGGKLADYGISDIMAGDLGEAEPGDVVQAVTKLNKAGAAKGVRFLYLPEKEQVYLYLVMDGGQASEYFARYYNVDGNKSSLDHYFNQYVSGGIKIRENAQGYVLSGNGMVSVMDTSTGDVMTDAQGRHLVGLLSGTEDASEQLRETMERCSRYYRNLNSSLMEEEEGFQDTVFENLIRLKTPAGASEGAAGLEDYLEEKGGKAEFITGQGTEMLKAVLVDSETQPGGIYEVADSKLRLVVAIGDVAVTSNFQGLIIASGRIRIADSVTVKKDGEGVYAVLQAESAFEGDTNVPANVFYNGPGMILGGYEAADVDESGNLNIDYSKIVRYENWIKK